MRKSIIIYILFFCFSLLSAQSVSKVKNVNVLFFKENIKVKIYDNYGKAKIVGCIYDDPLKENYYILEVITVKHDMLKISGSSVLNNNVFGWIEFKNIAINTRTRDNKILLYEKPNYLANHIVIHQADGELVQVTAISSSWLKIVLTYKNKTYNLWLPSKYQCPNPYTTCN